MTTTIVTVGDTTWTIPETVNLFDGTDVYIKGEGLPHADGEQLTCELRTIPLSPTAFMTIEAPVLNGIIYFYLPVRFGFSNNDLYWHVTVTDYFSVEPISFKVGESNGTDFVPVFFYPNNLLGNAHFFNINGVEGLKNDSREIDMVGLTSDTLPTINNLLQNAVNSETIVYGTNMPAKPILISSPIPFKFIEVCPEMVHLFWKRGDTGSINNFWFHIKKIEHDKNELKTVRLPFTDGNHERSLYMPNIEIELTSGDHEAYILKELQSIGSAIWVKAVGWGVAKEDGYPVDVNLTRNDYSPIDNKMGAIEITMKQNFTKPANLII